MIRLGLCCQFAKAPIKFSTTTASSLVKLSKQEAAVKLSRLCMSNALALQAALLYCAGHQIGCFRINSQVLPLKTHPQLGYDLHHLPEGKEIIRAFEQCKTIAAQHGLRTVFHPDQFILLSSPHEEVTLRSIADLDYQAEVSQWIGADVINIHGGGAYGNKDEALKRVASNVKRLSKDVRSRLTFENDDTTYTPQDLLPLCQSLKIPLVYDVHHHRCLKDGLSIEQATQAALATWDREPLFHLSSPKEGWDGPDPLRHHDFIDPNDFPSCWRNLSVTVEIEAKAKELAVEQIYQSLL